MLSDLPTITLGRRGRFQIPLMSLWSANPFETDIFDHPLVVRLVVSVFDVDGAYTERSALVTCPPILTVEE